MLALLAILLVGQQYYTVVYNRRAGQWENCSLLRVCEYVCVYSEIISSVMWSDSQNYSFSLAARVLLCQV